MFILVVFLCGRLWEGCKLTPGLSPFGWLNLTWEVGATYGVIVLHGILDNSESQSAYIASHQCWDLDIYPVLFCFFY